MSLTCSRSFSRGVARGGLHLFCTHVFSNSMRLSFDTIMYHEFSAELFSVVHNYFRLYLNYHGVQNSIYIGHILLYFIVHLHHF